MNTQATNNQQYKLGEKYNFPCMRDPEGTKFMLNTPNQRVTGVGKRYVFDTPSPEFCWREVRERDMIINLDENGGITTAFEVCEIHRDYIVALCVR